LPVLAPSETQALGEAGFRIGQIQANVNSRVGAMLDMTARSEAVEVALETFADRLSDLVDSSSSYQKLLAVQNCAAEIEPHEDPAAFEEIVEEAKRHGLQNVEIEAAIKQGLDRVRQARNYREKAYRRRGNSHGRSGYTQGHGGWREMLAAPEPLRFKETPFKDLTWRVQCEYLVKGLFPRKGLAVVWGPPKCCKSFWTFDVMMHIALGWKYRGRRVHQHHVAYLALEGQEGFHNRGAAWRQHFLEPDVDVPAFHLIPATLDLVKDHSKLIADIKEQTINPACVVIDTLMPVWIRSTLLSGCPHPG
jgi:hypothetical protein